MHNSSEVNKERVRREPNMQYSEREVLLDIMEEHVLIIDCKRTDSVNIERKRKEWEMICTKFNSMSSIYYRDVPFLKQTWENLKKRVKKEHAEWKLQSNKKGFFLDNLNFFY